jgi:hypothetical protein
MPAQELFLDVVLDGRKVQVIKTYDQAYAKEVFGGMDDDAKSFLWQSLKPEELYDPSGLPREPGTDYDAFLLDEMLEQGREEWNTFSYFVVVDEANGLSTPSFVSPDWPTSEAFARSPRSSRQDRLPRPDNEQNQGPL